MSMCIEGRYINFGIAEISVLIIGVSACVGDGIESIEEGDYANTEQLRSFEEEEELTDNNDASSAPAWGGSARPEGRLNADFNGDGYADLVIGVTFEVIHGEQSGAVNVLYGSEEGLTGDDDQFWYQDKSGVKGSAEDGDRFSEALAVGDFDGDGYDDLAIGVPNENVDSVEGAGAVNVLYGSEDGLKSGGDQLWHQDSTDIRNTAEPQDSFGSALASGDFNGDGRDDLAIGVPLEDVIGEKNAGMVNVIYGSSSGLTSAGNQAFHQKLFLVGARSEAFDFFGGALAAGDFNGDGRDDLAIGVAGEDLDSLAGAGEVNVLYGTGIGLSVIGYQIWNEDTPHVDGLAESFDRFGEVLSAGDFNHDGRDDLVIGIPGEDFGSTQDTGAINVIYGSGVGLAVGPWAAVDNQIWHQAIPGVDGLADPFDQFGWSLAVGDFDRDGTDDLAIGVPFENLSEINNGGLVNVLYGATGEGLSGDGDQLWHQNIRGIKDSAEANDLFGFALTAGDYDGDGAADLAIGVPDEDIGPLTDAGAINVIYGGGSGLRSPGDQVWHQDVEGVHARAEEGDGFGYSLR
jgi:hypothetical protein